MPFILAKIPHFRQSDEILTEFCGLNFDILCFFPREAIAFTACMGPKHTIHLYVGNFCFLTSEIKEASLRYT